MSAEKMPIRVWGISKNEVEVVVPYWRSTHIVKLPITSIPHTLLPTLKVGTRFLACGNINAFSEEELNLSDFEPA